MRVMDDPSLEILTVNPIHDQLGEVECRKKGSLLGFQRNTNVVVYSHVTAYARIRLARDMLELTEKGCRIYYCDTGTKHE